MRSTKALFLLGTLASLIAASGCVQKQGEGHIEQINPKVVQIVVQVLEARLAAKADPADRDKEHRLAQLLAALYENETHEADEACAVLLGYYLGEANDEDLLHNVTVRGSRVLLYLEGSKRHLASLPTADRFVAVAFDDEERRREIDRAIEYIKANKIWGVD